MKKVKKDTSHKKYDPYENLPKYIRDLGRKLEVYETRLDKEVLENGLGYVIVSRKRMSGDIIYANYLVDIFCLGVKDVYYEIMSEEEYRERLTEIEEEFDVKLEMVDPMYCYNLLYGAIEYAEDLGFEPHKDFAIAEKLLPDVEDIDYVDIEFGKNGKPFFFQGPGDNAAKIIGTLERTVGPNNFDVFLAKDYLDEEDDDEYDEDDDE